MTRTLPWLVDEKSAGKFKKRPSSIRPPRHDGSTNPDAPPTLDELKPGLDGDDNYVMVEDEFLATARTFTQHLHRAEYERLQMRPASPVVKAKNDSHRDQKHSELEKSVIPEPWKGTRLHGFMESRSLAAQSDEILDESSDSAIDDLDASPVRPIAMKSESHSDSVKESKSVTKNPVCRDYEEKKVPDIPLFLC